MRTRLDGLAGLVCPWHSVAKAATIKQVVSLLCFMEIIYMFTMSSAADFGRSSHASLTVASGVMVSFVLPINSL